MAITWNNEAFKQIKILTPPENPAIFGLLVEGGIKIPEINVIYNDALSASLIGGDTATLPIASKKMKSDIKITVPESAFSPLPIEVATEAEMTALLTSGEVGGVYKYTGTTGTYENGALYVLEEEEESIVGTWKLNDTLTVPTAFSDVSVTGTCYAFNYSQEIDSFDIGTVSATAGTSFKIQTSSIAYNIYYVAGDARCRDDGDESSINVPTDDTRMTQLRTITITEEPTDETFIAWLKANATKQ